jgi:hypothetical protein
MQLAVFSTGVETGAAGLSRLDLLSIIEGGAHFSSRLVAIQNAKREAEAAAEAIAHARVTQAERAEFEKVKAETEQLHVEASKQLAHAEHMISRLLKLRDELLA